MAIEEVWDPYCARHSRQTSSTPRASLAGNEPELTEIAAQEFSIEIPDKDADTIHSGMLSPRITSAISPNPEANIFPYS